MYAPLRGLRWDPTRMMRGAYFFPACARGVSCTSYEPPQIDGLTSKKWVKLEKEVKEEIMEYLDWKMEGDWKAMPASEKKASYFVSFGEWGPRAKPGSKEAQLQMTGAEIILRGVFSGVLFMAVAVSIMNYQKDRQLQKNLKKLEDTAER
ncbi:LAQU0S14e02476g1_1 [Lachancea quebecensis]|uniref:LAQU0S14e02476g1_1 n=1 Tax=Lachancea quebecensis TaxID=1654605 RepID=A0A0N7MM61_9SACH|nr:LAQU0S14e02476g1_1 [Lachancea quebecensis]